MKTKLSIYDVERIHKAASILREHYTQGWTINELAIEVKLTDKKLKAGFKEIFQMGVHAYMRSAQIKKVKELLITDKTNRAILLDSGFKSESGLSKTFKKVVGVTPKEFKNNPALWDNEIMMVYKRTIELIKI